MADRSEVHYKRTLIRNSTSPSLAISETTVIAPRSIQHVNCLCPERNDYSGSLCFVDTSSFSEKDGVAVAAGVVHLSNSSIPVRFLNPTDRSIKLVKGTVVTRLEECTVLDGSGKMGNEFQKAATSSSVNAIARHTPAPTLEDVHAESAHAVRA